MLRRIVFGCALGLLMTSSAYAAHPLVTDDTGSQGAGNAQIEVNGEYAVEDGFPGGVETKERAGEVGFVFSLGLSDSTDIVVGLPYQRYQVKEDGATVVRENGLSDVTVEVKHRFYENSGVSLAVKPGMSLPTGAEDRGLGAGRPGYSLTLIATAEAGPWTIHSNAGYAHQAYKLQADEDAIRSDIWHLSVAAEYEVSEALTFVANIGMERNEDKTSGSHPAFALAGMIYSVNDTFDINCGFKAGLNDAEADAAFLAGIAARF